MTFDVKKRLADLQTEWAKLLLWDGAIKRVGM